MSIRGDTEDVKALALPLTEAELREMKAEAERAKFQRGTQGVWARKFLRLVKTLEAMDMPFAQWGHAWEWIDFDGNERADEAIIKITDASGHAICSLTAAWLKRVIWYQHDDDREAACQG
jgi:hypothetical protein